MNGDRKTTMHDQSAKLCISTNSGLSLRADDRAELRTPGAVCAAWHVARAMRPHHWSKNLLVFVPPLLLQDPLDLSWMAPAVVAFMAFNLCASAGYLINDVLDIEADRLHPHKRRRPFAAGMLPVSWGPRLAAVALALGLAAGAAISLSFAACLTGYVLISSLYSSRLKPLFLVDVVTLAALFTLRLFAGGVATGFAVSSSLLACCLLLFLSLALAKRYSELKRLTEEGQWSPAGRGYAVKDLGLVGFLGRSCGYLAGLVGALCLAQGAASGLYHFEMLPWLAGPLYFYWISRLWNKAVQGEALEDPVAFVLQDPLSVATGCGLVAWLQIPTMI